MDLLQNVRQRKGKKPSPEEFVRESSSRDTRIDRKGVPNTYGYITLFIGVIIIYYLSIFYNHLPKQLSVDEEYVHTESFIGQRAESFLKRLTHIGTRVVGSYENEYLAVDLIQREISFIIQQKDKMHVIETDVQKPTGSYYLSLKPHNFRNYYANIQNIVVKLSSKNSTSHSILLNCHYDTVPESPGASDNGLNCAVLMEILTKLSKSNKPLRNSVIFLFNGAEENPLQASHGFITQHKWSKDVKVVINLDSAGAGGGEILFQATSTFPWLVKTYAKVAPYPSGGVHGEELFESGIIPSDTDFRIFRDFGKVPGLDFAHAGNGYVYHTRFDKMEFISPGVYQHTGENILELTRALASAEDLEKLYERDQAAKSRVVYYDLFGQVMVVYDESVADILNIGTVIVILYTAYRIFTLLSDNTKPVRKLLIYFFIALMSKLLAATKIFLVAKMLDSTSSTMSWYTRQWLIIPLYAVPFIIAESVLPLLTFVYKRGINAQEMAVRFIIGNQVLLSLVLLIGTLFRIRTCFLLFVILAPSAIINFCLSLFRKYFTCGTYITTYVLLTSQFYIFELYQGIRALKVLIPMTARMGPHSQPELVIGGLVVVFGILTISHLVPLIITLRKPKFFLISLVVVHLLAVVTVTLTSYTFPYSGDVNDPSMQRFYILHCERTFHDSKGNVRKSDSGFFVQSFDRNNINYVVNEVPELKKARSAAAECISELNCGVPVFTSRFIKPAPFGFWVDAFAPVIHHATNLVVTSQSPINVRKRRISFAVTGPDHITIVMSPRMGVKLVGWTFDDQEPRLSSKWGERDNYMVYYSHGLMGGTLEFSLDLEVDQETSVSDSIIDIAVIGHYMHDRQSRTQEFKEFLLKFPDWAHLTAWTTTYKSWAI